MKKTKKSTSMRFFNGDNSSLENKESVNINMITKFKSFFKRSFNSKFNNLKVRYKKDPKKGLALVLAIVALFSTLVGSSYAYLQYVSKTNNSTVINAGTLALTFNGSSNSIMLTGALPQSDSDGLANSAEYEFSIENTGSIPANYRLTLDNVCSTSSSYSIDGTSVTPSLCIPNEYIKVAIKEGDNDYKVLEKKAINNETSYVIDADSLKSELTRTYKMKIWLDYDTPNTYSSSGSNVVIYAGKLGLSYEQGSLGNLDNSGANKPVLDDGMIPVYYDETSETWKKADETNKNEIYKWYDYDNKMWANSVTVSSVNRSTYQKASLGTEIPMSDILTMEVWIPRYKYKVWNYNADGTVSSNPQEIEITFENGTAKTGEISCTDSISGTEGAPSETCKLKATNAACTDSTCNNKYYTHPAFTFGEEELKGFWIGKFELTGTISSITTKPNLTSLRSQNVGSFETNIMAMNDIGNIYGLSTSTDTHMIKNMEWGAVAYLSHSKYGTCTGGTCEEVYINNSGNYYTGRSGETAGDSNSTNGIYEYNEIGLGTCASTTHNIYGVYDMSGGAYEYVMGNIVSNNGTTMMSGYNSSSNSGYTGIIYDSGNYTSYTGTYSYPNSKYYDKYSFGTSEEQIIRSKLGDSIKEIFKKEVFVGISTSSGWYYDEPYLAYSNYSWFRRGGTYISYNNAGVFSSSTSSSGNASDSDSSRLIITP